MSVIPAIYRWFEYPHRFLALRKRLAQSGVVVLDVGCGNHSPRLTKSYFPGCRYEGLDCRRWNRDARDDAAMDLFYEVDLENPADLARLPDHHYQVIFCSHVLEHLTRPAEVLAALCTKLRPGGAMYIEVPSPRSLSLPRAHNGWCGIKGCLNFWDDLTHRQIVPLEEIVRTLDKAGLAVVARRPRFLWRRVLFLPLYALAGLMLRGYIPASVLWDILGFAEVVIAESPVDAGPVPTGLDCHQRNAECLPGSYEPGAKTETNPNSARPEVVWT